MNMLLKRTTAGLALATLLAGSFVAGHAYAYDSKLDDADANVEKAIALLEAAQNPAADKAPFNGHRAKAIILLKSARKQIDLAKKASDRKEERKEKREERKKDS